MLILSGSGFWAFAVGVAMAINAASMDTRVKATVASTMYDMTRVNAKGYFDAMNENDRYQLRKKLNEQRTTDYKNGYYALAGGVVDPLPADAPQFCQRLLRLLQDRAWLPPPAL